MTKQLEALIADMKAAAELIVDGYRREWEEIHDSENGVDSIGCVDDDGELSAFVEVSISNYSGDEKHDAELADYFVKSHPANVLTLIAALEQAQQYAKQRDEENQDLMLTIGRLRVEREQLESTLEREREKSRRVMSQNHQLEASPLAVKLPEEIDFDCEYENGEYGRDDVPWLRGRVAGFNEAIAKVKHAAGGTVEGE